MFLAIAVSLVTLQAAPQPCADPSRELPASGLIPAPSGYTTLFLGTLVKGVLTEGVRMSPESAGQWMVERMDFENSGVLVWKNDQGTSCYQTVTVPAPQNPDSTRTDTTRVTVKTYTADGCRAAAGDWMSDTGIDGKGETVIIVEPGRGVCYRSEDYGVVGDPIYVGVFTHDQTTWARSNISFEPCSLEPDAPAIYSSGSLSAFGRQTATDGQPYFLFRHLPRACFNKSVSIEVSTLASAGAGAVERERLQLNQFDRYRAGLQLGVVFTDLHRNTFGVRDNVVTADDGTSTTDKVVYLRELEGQGPRYFASLTIYSVLHYLGELAGGGRYLGRDIVHDQSFVDRLGLVLGVGLKSPGDEFVGGFGLEVVRGLSLNGVWYFTKIDELSGLSIGEKFSGQAADIPVTKTWASKFELGMSVDARYMTALFQSGGG